MCAKQNEPDVPQPDSRMSARSEDARRVIFQSFGHQIDLARKLVMIVREARERRGMETNLIEEVSRVCQQFIETDTRLPELRYDKQWQEIRQSITSLFTALQDFVTEACASLPSSDLEEGLKLSFAKEALQRENAALRRENESLKEISKQLEKRNATPCDCNARGDGQ